MKISLICIILLLSSYIFGYSDPQDDGLEDCEIPPLGLPAIERVQKRTYPSVALPGSSYVTEEKPVRWFTDAYPQDEVWTEHYARHDITYFAEPEGMR